MNTPRPLWAWLFFLHLALVVCATVLATRGALPVGVFQPPVDKLGHLGAYGLLAFLGVRAFGHSRRWQVIGALLVVSTLDELSQRAFPTRTFDLRDLAMNVIGILVLGWLAAWRSRARSYEVVPDKGTPPAGRCAGRPDHSSLFRS
jgi:VanZ family protein